MQAPGTPKPDLSSRASFCAAANHLTQLYISSMRQEKLAYQKGYSKAVEDVIRYLTERQQASGGQAIVPVDVGAMAGALRERRQEVLSRQSIGEGDGEECPSDGGAASGTPGGSMNSSSTMHQPGPSNSNLPLSHSLMGNTSGMHAPSMGSPLQMSTRPDRQPRNHLNGNVPRPRLQQDHRQHMPQPRQQPFTFGTPHSDTNQSTSAPSNPFQTNMTSGSSFSSSEAPTTQPFSMLASSTTADTFSQAVTIPLAFGDQGSSQSTRKRQFFEFIFESPPPPQSSVPPPPSLSLSSAISSSAPTPSLAALLPPTTTSTCTPITSLGSDVEGVTMDFSSYEQVWKRSRRGNMDEPLPEPSSEASTSGFDPSVLVSSSHS